MKIALLALSLVLSHASVKSGDSFREIPVFDVNFYLMGMEEVDGEVLLEIGANMEYLNEEFQGVIKFALNAMVMDPNHEFIPDLHQDLLKKNKKRVNELLSPIEMDGAINIYLFDTYLEPEKGAAMMGFTPVLSAQQKNYEIVAPQFDRLFISYSGLKGRTTIVHEIGHFLGLKHPWELSLSDREDMGLNEVDSERNHMTYHPEVDHFSPVQLKRMHNFAMTYRNYLIHHIERVHRRRKITQL